MNYRLSIYFIFIIFTPNIVISQTFLDDIPPDCNNKKGLYLSKDNNVDANPTWVEKCEDVCIFDEERKKVISKKTIWYSRRTCDEKLRFILVNNCSQSKEKPECNEIISDNDNKENHDCYTNIGGEKIWQCLQRALPVSCNYKDQNEDKTYNESILHAFCEKKIR